MEKDLWFCVLYAAGAESLLDELKILLSKGFNRVQAKGDDIILKS
jgi:hypothetical protein